MFDSLSAKGLSFEKNAIGPGSDSGNVKARTHRHNKQRIHETMLRILVRI